MRFRLVLGGLSLLIALVGCGTDPSLPPGSAPATLSAPLTPSNVRAQWGGLPANFVTLECVVTQLLPDNNNGFGHQRFMVRETAPSGGVSLEVDNDKTNGTVVPNLQPGEPLEIRGVLWNDVDAQGIHWTHHYQAPNDAGYIVTPDGQIYQ